MIDYKISHIIRYADITEVKIRVYLGDITTENEKELLSYNPVEILNETAKSI